MRYIGRTTELTTVQIDPDRNSYVNVKAFGAAGIDRFFTARVAGVGGSGNVLTVTDVQDFQSYQQDYFKVGQELYAFFYRETSIPGEGFDGIFTSAGIQGVGSIVNSGLNAKQLKYFLYPYNVVDGIFSPYRSTITLDDVAIDPKNQFDENNFARVTFNRPNSNWLPLVFRQWGTGPVEFLGVPSNNIFGSAGSVSFNDRGATQIPSWDESLGSQLPEFLSNVLSFAGSGLSAFTIVQKRRLRIITTSFSGNLECEDADQEGRSFAELNDPAIKIKFVFDDTSPIQSAVDFAATSGLKDVFIPSGVYPIRNIRVYDSTSPGKYNGMTLRGSGESTTIKCIASSANPIGQYGVIGVTGNDPTQRVSNISITNINFDGNKTDVYPVRAVENDIYGIGNKYNDFIAIEFADSVRVSNCSFFNGSGSAIYALNCTKLNITDNRAYLLSRPYEVNISPLKIRETSSSIIQGNLFENCSGPLDFMGVDGSTINNNIIADCGETGIQLNASDTWSAQGNLAFSQSGSLIRSVDTYNNEYSRASLDVKRGHVMTPIYFTVSDGNLPVYIERDTIRARVYPLKSNYTYNTAGTNYFLQVLETGPQLEAGIFAVTAPISTILNAVGGSNQGKNILGTNSYALLDPAAGSYGYAYNISATVSVGDFAIRRVAWAGPDDPTKIKLFFNTPADILSLYFIIGGSGNDSIKTTGIRKDGSILQNWPDGREIEISSIDQVNAAVVVDATQGVLSSVSALFQDSADDYNTPSGRLGAVKSNYFIADGNIYVSE